MKRVVVINSSHGYYNLGAQKIVNWQREIGNEVEYFDGDPSLFMPKCDELIISLIFSWNAPLAADIAIRNKGNSDIFCGGTGLFALKNWWKKETGIDAHIGLDDRFENQKGEYRMTFASRGCSVGCYFCIVPKLEGTTYKLKWDFQPASILCDNNLSDLPIEFQEHIIKRYIDTDTKLIDANSGFEPRSFDEDTYRRWKPIMRGAWRFAFDTISEEPELKRMMDILKPESSRRKRVYCLVGNEPIEQCYYRAIKIIEWGGEPYCQPFTPLNALRRDGFKVQYNWTKQNIKDFVRYFNRPAIWRGGLKLYEYSNRKGEKPPFEFLKEK